MSVSVHRLRPYSGRKRLVQLFEARCHEPGCEWFEVVAWEAAADELKRRHLAEHEEREASRG